MNDLVTPTDESRAFEDAFETPIQYERLEDIFGEGNLEVWYMQPEFFRFGLQGARPNHDPDNLLWTHVRLGSIPQQIRATAADATLDAMWMELQGERWSPNGEARNLIQSKGLKHTSMSIGDCFKTAEGAVWMVTADGFKVVCS